MPENRSLCDPSDAPFPVPPLEVLGTSGVFAPLRRPALWLAVLAALGLHAVFLGYSRWWRLPWSLPQQPHPTIMVQLLQPPQEAVPLPVAAPEANTSVREDSSAAAAVPPLTVVPTLARQQVVPIAAPSPVVAPAKQTVTEQAPVAPTSASSVANPNPLSVMQEMQAPESAILGYQIYTASTTGDRTTASAIGQAQLRWKKQDESQYMLTWEQSIAGKTAWQQSAGNLGAAGLQPLRYSETGTGKSEVATHFVGSTGQIVFSNNSPSAKLTAGVQDRLSVLMQLGGILAAQLESQTLSPVIQIPVANSSQARVWQFHVLGLQAALPAVRAQMGADASPQWLAVSHDPSRDGGKPWEPTMTIWYDTKGFLPVRIWSQYSDGQVQDAHMSSNTNTP